MLSFPMSCDSHKQSSDPVHSSVPARPQVRQVIGRMMFSCIAYKITIQEYK